MDGSKNTALEVDLNTIQELEELSASGKRFGLAANLFELRWTAGTQGAISEFSALGRGITTNQAYPDTICC